MSRVIPTIRSMGGTLCPKGASQMQLAISPRLRKSPMYREAGSSEWREVDWDFAMDWFARKFKASRDATFIETDAQDRTVNRTNGIAWVGSATVANGGTRISSRRRCAPWGSPI